MIEQLALFDGPEPVARSKPRSPKSVAHGVCPAHPWTMNLTGIIAGGRHLHWRPHMVRVGLRTSRRWCSASDAAICTVRPLQVQGQPEPGCRCGQ